MLGFHPRVGRMPADAGNAAAPPDERMRLLLPIIGAACIGAVLSLTAFYLAWRWEDRASRTDFIAACESRILALQHGLEDYLNLEGFVHGAFPTGPSIERILRATTPSSGLDLFLFAADAGASDLPLYTHSSRLRAVPAAPQSLATVTGGSHFAAMLKAGEARWRLVAVPVPGGPLTAVHDRAWLVLAASLLIGGVVVLYLSDPLRHARRLFFANQQISRFAHTDPLTDELDRDLRERVALSDQLRVALRRNEFELYYQPQVDVVSGGIIGVEALLRWNHPTRGFLTPAAFIAIAERTGSIVGLGAWVFDDACRQMRSWSDRAIAPAVLAVNFSAVQFKAATCVDAQIAASLDKWGLQPGNIEVELTESVLFEVTQQHQEIFERLRRLGVRIAIDDFGTGYSSLSYLTSYPANRLKIAQELVMGVIDDPRNATVVRAAIHLASELGVECIAEGVENEGQADFLVSAGCRQAQGYYFAEPVPAGRMTELLTARVIGRKPAPPADPSPQRLAAGAPAASALRVRAS